MKKILRQSVQKQRREEKREDEKYYKHLQSFLRYTQTQKQHE